jgi:hypothetical protein
MFGVKEPFAWHISDVITAYPVRGRLLACGVELPRRTAGPPRRSVRNTVLSGARNCDSASWTMSDGFGLKNDPRPPALRGQFIGRRSSPVAA